MTTPQLGLTARAIVDRVIDGDTVDVHLHLPCRVRMLDCWAPERYTEPGASSKQHLEKLLPVGANVIVQIPTQMASNVKDVFTFGRVLGSLWLHGDDESVSQIMVGAGFATAEKQK